MITRTDISKYVIHSVRKPDQNDFPKKDYDFNENHYLPLTYGDNLNNEIEVLTNIVREGGLRADLSFRKGRSTIYGDTPCDMFYRDATY